MKQKCVHCVLCRYNYGIFDININGHLRVAQSLCFKERLSAKPLKSTHFFMKKDFALILVLKMRVFGTRKWPIR